MSDIEYTVIVHEDEDGGFWTDVPALPGTGSQGDTVEEAVQNTREAVSLMVEYLRSRGEPIPAPKDLVVKITVAA
ncbi:MAG: type II toxin-antitoxin system HicB family antitoxin [Chloroflexota bacterium]|nr:type II toxin-antitoxin system HicB family antitoxin [Chloroflexota bacterium]